MIRTPMHVLFLAPDTHVYNHGFLRGLRSLGVRVSAIGMASADKLSPEARKLLDAYRGCDRLLDFDVATKAAKELATPAFDRIETIDEPLVEVAAALRERLSVGLPDVHAHLPRSRFAFARDGNERVLR